MVLVLVVSAKHGGVLLLVVQQLRRGVWHHQRGGVVVVRLQLPCFRLRFGAWPVVVTVATGNGLGGRLVGGRGGVVVVGGV